MPPVQQIIPQDSAVKQTVVKDSAAAPAKAATPVAAPVEKVAAASNPKASKDGQKPVTPPEPLLAVAADSVPAKDTIVAETPAVSLFTQHILQPTAIAPIEKADPYPGWITILLLGCIVVIAYLRAIYPKRFVEFSRALLDMRFASQMVREEKVLSQRVSVFLTFIFFLTASAFLYILTGYFHIQLFEGDSLLLFAKIGICIFLLFISRWAIVELTGFIFKASHEFSFYGFHIFLFNKALGLALIPVLVCLVYVSAIPKEVFIYTGIFLFILSYVARLIRGLNIGLARQGFNKLYLFFYFCTLEILPAVVLAKIILKYTAY